jgi:hypothetical protein
MNLIRLCCFLLFTQIYSQDIRINELVASNSTFQDEDGDTPDWIELYNYGSSPVSLINWSISDEEDDTNPWVFPEIILNEDEYMLLWASNKNRGQLTYPRTLITEGDLFKYITPTSSVSSNWTSVNYNDNSWSEGSSGFGYSDSDDNTNIPSGTLSVFIRKDFTILDINNIVSLILDIDYDDGFVAYINGFEVARANINGSPPAYNATTNTDHEAQIYVGGYPERFVIDNFQNILIEGTNTLSIQAHNVSDTSSDFTLIPFLTGIFSDDTSQGIFPPDVLQYASENTSLHTDFKLSSSGETIYLKDNSGNLVDSLSFENLLSDVSIGVSTNSTDLVYFQTTTPNDENDNSESAGIVSSVIQFSDDGGALNNTINLSLSGNEDGEYIRYTLDSSEPDYTSIFYDSPIQINSTTVVRAKIFKNNYIPGYSDTRSYFYNINHDIPFVSIVSDPYNLFDNDYGIYELGDDADGGFPYFGANFWEDWERPAHFSLFNPEGELEIEFNTGIKIFGAYSRGNAQKSFAFFARGQYGLSEFNYPFFSELNYSKFQSFILRNSGNDWLKSQIKDAANTSLMYGTDLEYQSHQSVASYLNGQYWGLYNIREKVNEHFLASKANVDPDEIDILTNNAEIVHGTNEEYLNLINFISLNSLNIQENYEYVKSQIDIDNFIIHNVIQIYGDNQDWPGNNIKYWKTDGGKWRWILYDTDFSFSGQWWAWDVNNHYLINTLNFVLSGSQTNWASAPWATFMLRNLIKNTEFRHKFVNRYADEINTRFLPSDVVQHFNDIYDVILDEIPDHMERWNSTDNPYYFVEHMINFAVNRPDYAKEHILIELDLPNYHKVSLENSTPNFGFVRVNNNLKIQEPVWNGDYFEEVPITLKAVPEFGYAFSHWSGANNSTDEEITLDVNNDKFIEAHFVEDQTPTDLNIVINEINYKSSDDFNSNDWVELYNPNSYEVDISNWIFSDDNDANIYEFPENTIIQQESYLVVVKDIDDFSDSYAEISNYVGEFDFGLSSSSDAVRLYNSEMVIQDEVYYTSSFPWPNLGNGDGYTLELISPSLDNSLPENWTNFNEHGSPNEVNSPTANTNSIEQTSSVLWPNPVEIALNITLNIKYLDNYTIELYDLKGVNLKEIFRGTLDLGDSNIFYSTDNLSSGVYLIKISSDSGNNKMMKFIKK